MKKLIPVLFFVLILVPAGRAQLDADLEVTFQNTLVQFKSISAAIGLSVAVHTPDGTWASAIGDNAEDMPLTTADHFGMGSVTKTITSAAMLRLQEEGLLDLDDPLGDYLDTLTNVDPDITLRQLLNHTSGIYNYTDHPDFFVDVFANPANIYDPVDIFDLYVNEPTFEPGTSWGYSNTNYVLLGMVIEAVAGQPYETEVAQQFVFATEYPSIQLAPQEYSPDDLAHLWMDLTFNGNPPVDVQASGMSLNAIFSLAGAAGAYVCTPTDLAKWASDLYSGSLLDANSMTELKEVPPASPNYGLGVFVEELPCGQPILGHTGGIFYTTATFYDPNTEIAVSAHCNDASVFVTSELAAELICEYAAWLQTTSTTEPAVLSGVQVFPNPATDQITVAFDQSSASELQLRLLNQLGQPVWFVQQELPAGSQQLTIDLPRPRLAAGLYVLELSSGTYRTTMRVVLE